jgi:tetratricopeptide (TPR) repeat protein
LQDLAVLWTDWRVRHALSKDLSIVGAHALEVLDQAEQLLGPSRIFYMQRRAVARKLQGTLVDPADWQRQPDWKPYAEVERAANEKLLTLPPGQPWERCAVARFYLHHDPLNLELARNELAEVLKNDPRAGVRDFRDAQRLRPWPWTYFYKGKCEYLDAKLEDAEDSFNDSLEMRDPDSRAGCFYNRALARSKVDNRTDSGIRRAIKDYDQALELDPKLIAAYINRGKLKLGLHQYEAALQDFRSALQQEPTHKEARQLFNSLSTSKK